MIEPQSAGPAFPLWLQVLEHILDTGAFARKLPACAVSPSVPTPAGRLRGGLIRRSSVCLRPAWDDAIRSGKRRSMGTPCRRKVDAEKNQPRDPAAVGFALTSRWFSVGFYRRLPCRSNLQYLKTGDPSFITRVRSERTPTAWDSESKVLVIPQVADSDPERVLT